MQEEDEIINLYHIKDVVKLALISYAVLTLLQALEIGYYNTKARNKSIRKLKTRKSYWALSPYLLLLVCIVISKTQQEVIIRYTIYGY